MPSTSVDSWFAGLFNLGASGKDVPGYWAALMGAASGGSYPKVDPEGLLSSAGALRTAASAVDEHTSSLQRSMFGLSVTSPGAREMVSATAEGVSEGARGGARSLREGAGALEEQALQVDYAQWSMRCTAVMTLWMVAQLVWAAAATAGASASLIPGVLAGGRRSVMDIVGDLLVEARASTELAVVQDAGIQAIEQGKYRRRFDLTSLWLSGLSGLAGGLGDPVGRGLGNKVAAPELLRKLAGGALGGVVGGEAGAVVSAAWEGQWDPSMFGLAAAAGAGTGLIGGGLHHYTQIKHGMNQGAGAEPVPGPEQLALPPAVEQHHTAVEAPAPPAGPVVEPAPRPAAPDHVPGAGPEPGAPVPPVRPDRAPAPEHGALPEPVMPEPVVPEPAPAGQVAGHQESQNTPVPQPRVAPAAPHVEAPPVPHEAGAPQPGAVAPTTGREHTGPTSGPATAEHHLGAPSPVHADTPASVRPGGLAPVETAHTPTAAPLHPGDVGTTTVAPPPGVEPVTAATHHAAADSVISAQPPATSEVSAGQHTVADQPASVAPHTEPVAADAPAPGAPMPGAVHRPAEPTPAAGEARTALPAVAAATGPRDAVVPGQPSPVRTEGGSSVPGRERPTAVRTESGAGEKPLERSTRPSGTEVTAREQAASEPQTASATAEAAESRAAAPSGRPAPQYGPGDWRGKQANWRQAVENAQNHPLVREVGELSHEKLQTWWDALPKGHRDQLDLALNSVVAAPDRPAPLAETPEPAAVVKLRSAFAGELAVHRLADSTTRADQVLNGERSHPADHPIAGDDDAMAAFRHAAGLPATAADRLAGGLYGAGPGKFLRGLFTRHPGESSRASSATQPEAAVPPGAASSSGIGTGPEEFVWQSYVGALEGSQQTFDLDVFDHHENVLEAEYKRIVRTTADPSSRQQLLREAYQRVLAPPAAEPVAAEGVVPGTVGDHEVPAEPVAAEGVVPGTVGEHEAPAEPVAAEGVVPRTVGEHEVPAEPVPWTATSENDVPAPENPTDVDQWVKQALAWTGRGEEAPLPAEGGPVAERPLSVGSVPSAESPVEGGGLLGPEMLGETVSYYVDMAQGENAHLPENQEAARAAYAEAFSKSRAGEGVAWPDDAEKARRLTIAHLELRADGELREAVKQQILRGVHETFMGPKAAPGAAASPEPRPVSAGAEGGAEGTTFVFEPEGLPAEGPAPVGGETAPLPAEGEALVERPVSVGSVPSDESPVVEVPVPFDPLPEDPRVRLLLEWADTDGEARLPYEVAEARVAYAKALGLGDTGSPTSWPADVAAERRLVSAFQNLDVLGELPVGGQVEVLQGLYEHLVPSAEGGPVVERPVSAAETLSTEAPVEHDDARLSVNQEAAEDTYTEALPEERANEEEVRPEGTETERQPTVAHSEPGEADTSEAGKQRILSDVHESVVPSEAAPGAVASPESRPVEAGGGETPSLPVVTEGGAENTAFVFEPRELPVDAPAPAPVDGLAGAEAHPAGDAPQPDGVPDLLGPTVTAPQPSAEPVRRVDAAARVLDDYGFRGTRTQKERLAADMAQHAAAMRQEADHGAGSGEAGQGAEHASAEDLQTLEALAGTVVATGRLGEPKDEYTAIAEAMTDAERKADQQAAAAAGWPADAVIESRVANPADIRYLADRVGGDTPHRIAEQIGEIMRDPAVGSQYRAEATNLLRDLGYEPRAEGGDPLLDRAIVLFGHAGMSGIELATPGPAFRQHPSTRGAGELLLRRHLASEADGVTLTPHYDDPLTRAAAGDAEYEAQLRFAHAVATGTPSPMADREFSWMAGQSTLHSRDLVARANRMLDDWNAKGGVPVTPDARAVIGPRLANSLGFLDLQAGQGASPHRGMSGEVGDHLVADLVKRYGNERSLVADTLSDPAMSPISAQVDQWHQGFPDRAKLTAFREQARSAAGQYADEGTVRRGALLYAQAEATFRLPPHHPAVALAFERKLLPLPGLDRRQLGALLTLEGKTAAPVPRAPRRALRERERVPGGPEYDDGYRRVAEARPNITEGPQPSPTRGGQPGNPGPTRPAPAAAQHRNQHPGTTRQDRSPFAANGVREPVSPPTLSRSTSARTQRGGGSGEVLGGGLGPNRSDRVTEVNRQGREVLAPAPSRSTPVRPPGGGGSGEVLGGGLAPNRSRTVTRVNRLGEEVGNLTEDTSRRVNRPGGHGRPAGDVSVSRSASAPSARGRGRGTLVDRLLRQDPIRQATVAGPHGRTGREVDPRTPAPQPGRTGLGARGGSPLVREPGELLRRNAVGRGTMPRRAPGAGGVNSLGEPVSHGPSLLRYLPKLPSVSDAARGLEEARGWLSRWLVPSTSDSHTPAQELKIRVEREVTTTEERSTDSAVPEVTTTEERSTDSAVPEVTTTEERSTDSAVPEETVIERRSTDSAVPEETVIEEGSTDSAVPEETVIEEGSTDSAVPEETVIEEGSTDSAVPEERPQPRLSTIEEEPENAADSSAGSGAPRASWSTDDSDIIPERDFRPPRPREDSTDSEASLDLREAPVWPELGEAPSGFGGTVADLLRETLDRRAAPAAEEGRASGFDVNKPLPEKPLPETPRGETPGSEVLGVEKPLPETPRGETPRGETPGSEVLDTEQPLPETPHDETLGSEVLAVEGVPPEEAVGAIRAEVTVAPADLIGTEDTLAGLGGRYDESLDLEDETGLTSSQGWDELLSRDVLANGFPHDDLLSVGTEPAAPQPAVVRVDLGGQFRSPVAVAEAILRPGVEPDAVISLDRAPALPDSRLKAWGSAISTLTGRPIRVTLGGGSEVMVSGAPDRGPRPAREAEPQGFRTFASHGVVTPGVFGSGLKSGRHQVPFSDVRSTPILTHGEGGPRHVGVDLTRDGLTGAERSHLPTSQRGQDAGFRQVDEAYALWSEETRQQGRQEPYVVVAEPVPGKPGLVRVEVDGRSETMGPESLVRYLRDSAGLNEVPQGLPVVLAIPHAAEPYAMGKGDTPRSFAQRFAESSEHPTYSVRGEIRYEGTGGAGGTEGPRISKPDTYGGRSNTFVRSEGGRPNEVAATAADTAVRPPVRERAHVLDQDHELGAFPRSSATPRAEANAQVGELGKHLVQIGELRAKFGLTAPSVSVEGHLFGAKHESWGSTTMTERRAESVKEALSGAIQVEKLLGDTEPGTAEIEVQSRSVFGPRSAGAERGQDGPEAARPEESNVTVTVRGGGLHPTDLHEEIGGEINDTLRSLSEDHPGSYGRLMASARSIAAEHGHDGFPTQAALNMIAYARLATTPDHLLHLLAWEVTRPEPLPEEGRKLVLKGHDRNPGPLDRQPGVDYRPSEWRPMPQPTGGDAIPQGLEDSGVMRYLKDLRETGADLTRSHVEMYIDVAPGRRPGKGPGVGSSVGLRWEIPGQGSTSAFFEQSGGEGGAARNFTGKGSVYVRPSGIERPAVSYPVRITAAQLERAVQYLTGRQASVLPTDKGVTFVRQAVEYITGKEAPGGRSYFGGPSDFAAALKTSQAMFLPENAWFDGTPGEGLPPRGPAAPEPRLVSA